MHSTRAITIGLVALGLAAGTAGAEEFRVEKRVAVPAGETFHAVSEGGGIEVRGGDGSEAVVLVTSKDDDFAKHFNVRFEEGPGKYGVFVERKERGILRWIGSWHGGSRIVVELPHGVVADLDSSGGGIEVSDVRASVKAESSGGGVRLTDVGGDVDVESSGGGVRVEGIGGSARLESSGGGVFAGGVLGDIHAESSGGGVTIEGAGGAVQAESSGGPVRVGFARGNARGGSVSSSGGGVTVRVDPEVGLDLEASASGGRVHCDLEVAVRGTIGKSSLHGRLNGGGARLSISSSGGGVRIEGL